MTTATRLTACAPLHEVRDADKLATLVAAMRRDGWQGRPLLAMPNGDGVQLLTGSHRYAAAVAAGLETVPVVCIPDEALDVDGWEQVERAMSDQGHLYDCLVALGLTDAAALLAADLDD